MNKPFHNLWETYIGLRKKKKSKRLQLGTRRVACLHSICVQHHFFFLNPSGRNTNFKLMHLASLCLFNRLSTFQLRPLSFNDSVN